MPELLRHYLGLTYAKTGRLRWLGHLDFARALERALRRSCLPVVYTRGYNPRMRLIFAAPLSVGHEGLAELCAIELAREVPLADVAKVCTAQTAGWLTISGMRMFAHAKGSPFAGLTAAVYELQLRTDGPDTVAALRDSLDALLDSQTVTVDRRTKSGVRAVDIRPFIFRGGMSSHTDEAAVLELELGLAEGRVAKPLEVFQSLADRVTAGRVTLERVVRRRLL